MSEERIVYKESDPNQRIINFDDEDSRKPVLRFGTKKGKGARNFFEFESSKSLERFIRSHPYYRMRVREGVSRPSAEEDSSVLPAMGRKTFDRDFGG